MHIRFNRTGMQLIPAQVVGDLIGTKYSIPYQSNTTTRNPYFATYTLYSVYTKHCYMYMYMLPFPIFFIKKEKNTP